MAESGRRAGSPLGLGSAARAALPEGKLLTLLLLFAAALHVWQLTHTEVAARDSIGYIRYAWQLEHQPWKKVVRRAEQHPGYPLAVLATSAAVRRLAALPDAAAMQLSAQLVSNLAGVLLVVPMFYLGRDLFDQKVGFWGALLFQCLPSSSRVLADGLSEATFLLFAVTALWLGVRALRGRRPLPFALCGLMSGLAYLTRPEGALVAAAVGLVFLGVQLRQGRRCSWLEFGKCVASLTVAACAVAGPFVAVTHRLTTKPTPAKLVPQAAGAAVSPEAVTRPRPVLAAGFAVWWDGQPGPGPNRVGWASQALALELVKGFYYVGWLPALVGLWWFRGRFWAEPGAWAVGLVCLAVAGLLWRVASVMGYVSDRHALLIVLCGGYWAAAALLALPGRLAAWGRRLSAGSRFGALVRFAGHPVAGPTLLVALCVSALPKSLQPLHYNRGGFREAGLWLARNAAPVDKIVDPYCWSHYYAGHVFLEGQTRLCPPGHEPVCYVVLEDSANPHLRLPEVAEAQRLREQGRVVYRWRGRRGRDGAEVLVYEVPMAAAAD